MGYIKLIIWQLWQKWFENLCSETAYLLFKKSSSDDVEFYRVYCEVFPLEVSYNTLHFEVYLFQTDPNDNTKLRANLSDYLLPGIIYNLGVTAINSAGNESDIATFNNVTI